MVERWVWPEYACEELNGAGWECELVRYSNGAWWVKFANARDDNDEPLPQEHVERRLLKPMPLADNGLRLAAPGDRDGCVTERGWMLVMLAMECRRCGAPRTRSMQCSARRSRDMPWGLQRAARLSLTARSS